MNWMTDTDQTTADTPATSGNTYITFDIGSQTFAADVSVVREILDLEPVTPLPNSTPGLVGMIDIRGRGTAVMDLSGALGLRASEVAAQSRIMVLDNLGGQRAEVAIIANQVRTVVTIASAAIDPVPAVPGRWNCAGMTGITRLDGRLVYLVDLQVLLGQGSDLPGAFDFT